MLLRVNVGSPPRLTQFPPPSVVRITAGPPPAQPIEELMKRTPRPTKAVVLVWAVQFAPPLAVARIVLFAPTAHPWVALTKWTENRFSNVPLVCEAQVPAKASALRHNPNNTRQRSA